MMKTIRTSLILCLLISACVSKDPSIELAAPKGGDFSIKSTRGMFNTENHRGKIIFLFFGFLRCPQVCPTTLANLNRMFQGLPEKDKNNVEFIFVSVDKRDTLDDLRQRLAIYPPSFQAGTGSEEEIRRIMQKFGGTFKIYPDGDDYLIDHTSSIFVINGSGNWVASLKYDSSVDELQDAFQKANSLSPISASHRSKNRFMKIVGSNSECDLGLGPCEFGGYQVKISPLPIVPERKYKIEVTLSDETLMPPSFVDIQGVEVNMGYIRPSLMRQKTLQYKANFYLPLCETPAMKWQVTIIQQADLGQHGLNFFFNSVPRSEGGDL